MCSPRLTPALVLISGLLLSTCSGLAEDPPLCEPGTLRCQLDKHVEICATAGDVWQHLKSCATHETCVDGTCVAGCAPACESLECGDDGCGGTCGACDEGYYCWEGECLYGHCEPDCEGKPCGDDGCGGSCGTCGAGYACQGNACAPICQGSCDGKTCGGDGCGGSCGVCEWPETCVGDATCECVGWCTDGDVAFECGPDGCGGECGDGCGAGEVCGNGQCLDKTECNQDGQFVCGGNCCEADEECKLVGGEGPYCCGATEELHEVCHQDSANSPWEVVVLDSCGDVADFVQACEGGCVAGVCQACAPACAGKECGGDGCDGTCGTCAAGWGCQDGHCVETTCECTTGPCCDGCHFRPDTFPCDTVHTEGCANEDCGGDVVSFAQLTYCDGHSEGCSGTTEPAKIDAVLEACDGTEFCDPDSLTCKPGASCTGGETCGDVAMDTYDATADNGTRATATFLVDMDAKVSPADIDMHVSATLHEVDDQDWYQFQTEDSYQSVKFSPSFSVPADAKVEIRFYCWSGSGHVDYVSMSGAVCTPDTLNADALGHGLICSASGSTVTFSNLRCGEDSWGDGGWSTGMRVYVVVKSPSGDPMCGSYAISID